jgi:integrase
MSAAATVVTHWPPKTLPRNFPLTVVPRGYVVTVGGRTRWVCGKRSPKEALAVFDRKVGAWRAGDDEPLPAAKPDDVGAVPTVHYILAKWLVDRRGDAERGDLTGGAYQQYKLSAKRIDAVAGHLITDDVTPDTVKSLYARLHRDHGEDFARRAISHLRACCRHAEDAEWCRPVRLGNRQVAKLTARARPSMKWRLYTADEVAIILDAADARIDGAVGKYKEPWVQLKAMILLALNGGYGATELAELPREVIDLDAGVIDYRRGKTKQDHVVPLWPETVEALRPVMLQRPGDALVFRTRSGEPWAYRKRVLKAGRLQKIIGGDNFAWAFRELVKPLGLKIDRQGPYKFKHLANTTADAFNDPHATFTLFGHALPGAKSHYVRVGDDRVRAVVEFMRQRLLHVWLVNREAGRRRAPAAAGAPGV